MSNKSEYDKSSLEDGEIVANSKNDTLYVMPFQNGKYFNMQFEAAQQNEFTVSSRIKLSLAYINEREDVSSFTLSRFKSSSGVYTKDGEIKLSSFDLAKIRDFLNFLQSVDLKAIAGRRLRLASDSLELTEDTKKQITTLLSLPNGLAMVEEIIKSGEVSSKDIINLGYRKQQLKIFEQLLSNVETVNKYRDEHKIQPSGEEAIWQYFFKDNQWIFGYGLKYQFLELITDQPHYGGQTLNGSGSQKGDFLMATAAARRFTVLVEIKTPKTELIGSLNRAGAHKIGAELIHGISQLQVNCQTWETTGSKIEQNQESARRENFYTHEPRGILVIGHTRQLDDLNKRNTFEIFRSNLRCPEILTFDELYERAKYIVEHSS
ncbi:MAG: hypothetical protein A2103_04480 [Gammaproteobacteria bacterium GWF2_41_13]|nr:MAG: hypothetical protein A2103_04480 [Gammaproteobacteria bacterium GWF2_41_13]